MKPRSIGFVLLLGVATTLMTGNEFRLLSYVIHHAGRVVSQLELTEHLYAQDFERDSNAVEVLVRRVRKKLGVDLIKTRRGFGYIIETRES